MFDTIPNKVVAVRLLMVPVLWIMAAAGQSTYLGLGLLLAALSDLLDGFLARVLNQKTEIGSKLDTFADNLIVVSGIFWLIMLEPAVFSDNLPLSLTTLALYISSLAAGWIRFRRLANLHLYSAKIAAVTGYAFSLHTFLMPGHNETLFLIAMGMFILTSTEALLVFLTSDYVYEEMGSIIPALRRDRTHQTSMAPNLRRMR